MIIGRVIYHWGCALLPEHTGLLDLIEFDDYARHEGCVRYTQINSNWVLEKPRSQFS